MKHERIVNGVNQAGKAPESEGQNSPSGRKKKDNATVRGIMCILNAFANFVCPIKDEKKRK